MSQVWEHHRVVLIMMNIWKHEYLEQSPNQLEHVDEAKNLISTSDHDMWSTTNDRSKALFCACLQPDWKQSKPSKLEYHKA